MVGTLALLAAAFKAPRMVVATRATSKPVAQLFVTGDEQDPGLPALGAALRAEAAAGVRRVVVLPGMVRIEASDVGPLGVTVLAWSGEAASRLAEADDPLVQLRWGMDCGGSGDAVWSYQAAWSPEATFLVVSAGSPRAEWEEAVSRVAWPGTRLPRYRTFEPLSPPLPDGLGALQWRAAPVKPGDARFARVLVAVCALGSGPSGVLRRVCRDTHPWSYDQDAVLWPTRSGYVPVSTVLWKADGQPEEAEVQKALEDKVMSLTEDDLRRAVRLAGWALGGGTRWSPLLVGPDVALGRGDEDRVTWRGFMEAWGAPDTGPEHTLPELEKVTLGELKQACGELLRATSRKAFG